MACPHKETLLDVLLRYHTVTLNYEELLLRYNEVCTRNIQLENAMFSGATRNETWLFYGNSFPQQPQFDSPQSPTPSPQTTDESPAPSPQPTDDSPDPSPQPTDDSLQLPNPSPVNYIVISDTEQD